MLETALFASSDGTGTDWRLLGVADHAAAAWHYVHLKFDVIGGQLAGWLVRRDSGEEIPLVDVLFDATRLSLRLPGRPPADSGLEKMPRLSLALFGDREFRGYYVDEMDKRLDPVHELKLVKSDEEFIT